LAKQFQHDTNGTLVNGLVSYYPMEGGPTDYYGSNNGTDSSVSYGTSYGKVNQGAGMSGGYISVTPTSTASAFSIAYWVKYNDFSSTYNGAIGRQISGSPYASGWTSWADTSGNYQIFGRSNSVNFVSESTGVTLNTGTWYHIAITWDSAGDGKMRFYKNGSLAYTSTGSSAAAMTGLANLLMGGLQWLNTSQNSMLDSQVFHGSIDEVGLWGNALSAQEVTDLWNGGAGQTMVEGMSLSSLNQYQSDAVTPIAEGSSTIESTVVFEATPNSTGTSNLQLQVEVKPAGASFTDIANVTSSYVPPGHNATATITNLPNGDYHWQARVMEDGTGATSTWRLFGSNLSSTDFTVAVPMSAYFNGDSAWGYPASSTGFVATDPFTIEFWYEDAATGTMQFLNTQTNGRNGFAIWRDSNGVNFSLNCRDASTTVQLSGAEHFANYDYVDSNGVLYPYWHHVAVTKASSPTSTDDTFKLYFDTVQQTSDQCYTSTSTDTIWIGGDPSSSMPLFNGDLDEVRIWNIERSPSDVSSSYNQEIPTSTTGLVDYWRFDGTSTDLVTGYAASVTGDPALFLADSPFGHFELGYWSVHNNAIQYNASTTYSSLWSAAVDTWNGNPQRKVHITSTSSVNGADLLVSDTYGTGALADIPGEYCKPGSCDFGSPTQDTIFLNTFTLALDSSTRIQNTATHELGHALGLAHSWYGNVMNYYQTTQTWLGPQDMYDYNDIKWNN
jgi:hypothetical protein